MTSPHVRSVRVSDLQVRSLDWLLRDEGNPIYEFRPTSALKIYPVSDTNI